MNNILENRISQLEKIMSAKMRLRHQPCLEMMADDRIKILKKIEQITDRFINDLNKVIIPGAELIDDSRLVSRCERTMGAAERIMTVINNLL